MKALNVGSCSKINGEDLRLTQSLERAPIHLDLKIANI